MDGTTTDGEIARRVLERDAGGARGEEAELVRRFAPRVRLFGLRHLRDEHAACDLVQQVLLITIRKLRAGEVREPERIASFVLGTARRTMLSMRREGRRTAQLADEEPGLAASLPPPPDPFARDALARCLEALGERQRSVVALTYYQDLSAGEVAACTGLSPGNVRVIRHRALRRLRDCLDGRGEEAA